VHWSPHPTQNEVRQEYERIWQQLGSRSIEELVELPLMNDPECLTALNVLTEVVTPALFTDENLLALVICRMVNLSLEHGNSDGSCFAYVWLGMLLGPLFGDYRAGFRFGRLGYELVEKRGLHRYQARAYMSFGNLVMPWTKHIQTGRDLVRRAFDAANKIGDLTFAAYSCNNLNTNLLGAGDPLGTTQRVRGAVEVVSGAGAGGFARFGKGRPRTAEYADADRRQFDDTVDTLQQRAVMAGDENAALPAFEQPRHGLPAIGVEIVGGLVQQQQVRRLDQEARQRQARSLAAAQRGDRAMQRQRRQSGFGQCRQHPGFQRPVRFSGVIKRAFAAFEPLQAGKIAGDAERFVDRQPFIGSLRKHADRADALQRSACRFDLARDQAKQCGFAAAVAADKAGALAPEGERQSIEQRASVRRGEGDGIQNEKGRHGELPKMD